MVRVSLLHLARGVVDNLPRRVLRCLLLQQFERVEPGLQFAHFARLVVALVGNAVGGRQPRLVRQGRFGQGFVRALDRVPHRIALGACGYEVCQADRMMGVAVLPDFQLPDVDGGANLGLFIGQRLAQRLRFCQPLAAIADVGVARQDKAAQRRKIESPVAKSRHGRVQFALAPGHARFVAVQCGPEVAQSARRSQRGAQGGWHRGHRQGSQLGLQRNVLAGFVGEGLDSGLARRVQRVESLDQSGHGRTDQQRGESRPERRLVASQPADLPHQRLHLLPEHRDFELTPFDVTLVIADFLPLLRQPHDVGRMIQPMRRQPDALQALLELRRLFGKQLPIAFCTGQLPFGLRQLPGHVRRQQHAASQWRQFGLASAPLAYRRGDTANAFQPNAFGLEFQVAGAQQVAPVFQLHHLVAGFHPLPGTHRDGFQGCLGSFQFVAGDVVSPVVGAAGCPQRVGFGSQLIAHGTEAGNACRRLEQDLADVVGCIQDGVAAFHQAFVVQAEHLLEETPVSAAHEPRQCRVGQHIAGRAQQGSGARLGTNEVQRLVALFKLRAESHLRLGMQEIQRRAQADAVQQVEDRTARGGFSSFVVSNNKMKIPAGVREGQRLIGELAVAKQVELSYAHRSFSAPAPVVRLTAA